MDYAARLASEPGAVCVKLKSPEYDSGRQHQYPKEQREPAISPEEPMNKVVRPAGKTLVFLFGGGKIVGEELLNKARLALEAGVAGSLFGRDRRQSTCHDSLRMTAKLTGLMLEYPM